MLFLPKRKIFTNRLYLAIHPVKPEHEGHRLDRFLQHRYPGFSRAKVHKIIKQKRVKIDRNGLRLNQNLNWQSSPSDQNTQETIDTVLSLPQTRASNKVHHGDEVVVMTSPEKNSEITPQQKPEKVFEDSHILILNKPPMSTVHPTGGSLFHSVLQLAQELFPSEAGLYLCHRLDRETSGLLVLARNKKSASFLSENFSRSDNRSPKKKYLAITHGTVSEENFTVDAPMGKDASSAVSLKMGIVEKYMGGIKAKTSFKVLERIPWKNSTSKGFSVLECELFTGRQHQIRVHLNHIGHPIVGDKLYGNPDHLNDELFFKTRDNPPDEGDLAHLIHSRHALHASSIDLLHPLGGSIKVRTPLPEDLRKLLDRLRHSQ